MNECCRSFFLRYWRSLVSEERKKIIPYDLVLCHSHASDALQRPFSAPLTPRFSSLSFPRTLCLSLSLSSFSNHQSDIPVLVDFWANWCGPCKLVAPLMGAVESECAGKLKVVKINTDSAPDLVERFKVYGLPCLALFEPGNSKPVAQREGAIGKKALFEWLTANGIEAAAAAASK